MEVLVSVAPAAGSFDALNRGQVLVVLMTMPSIIKSHRPLSSDLKGLTSEKLAGVAKTFLAAQFVTKVAETFAVMTSSGSWSRQQFARVLRR